MAKPSSHGEARHYWRGCRCRPCKDANNVYTQGLRRKLGKAYVRGVNLRHAHGIDPADYTKMLREQGNVCAVCGNEETGRNQFGLLPLAIDHDHTTGQKRGLLCMRCNRALGLLRDDPNVIAKLLAYITEWKQ